MRPFEEYLRKLLDLHIAMEAEDEAKADEIRDTMEKPWYALSEAEQRVADLVSEALYPDSKLELDKVPKSKA